MNRLENFEKALKDILNEYDELGIKLKDLRADGKMKTTQFRELLGRKLVYSMVIAIFRKYDLVEEQEELN